MPWFAGGPRCCVKKERSTFVTEAPEEACLGRGRGPLEQPLGLKLALRTQCWKLPEAARLTELHRAGWRGPGGELPAEVAACIWHAVC